MDLGLVKERNPWWATVLTEEAMGVEVAAASGGNSAAERHTAFLRVGAVRRQLPYIPPDTSIRCVALHDGLCCLRWKPVWKFATSRGLIGRSGSRCTAKWWAVM